jgi:SAM-dependent methyltransferase
MSDLQRVQEAYRKRIERNLVDRYSLFRPGELYMAHRREEAVLRALHRASLANLADTRILEVGCGRGHRLADFQRWGAKPQHIHGVDLMPAFTAEARGNYPAYSILRASGHQLPYDSATFDLVAQFTVFTSFPSKELRQSVAHEMLRVLKPGGIILWYDFRYPSPKNPDVSPVRRHEIHALFPDCAIRLKPVTLAPPVARMVARLSTGLCRVLELPPIMRTHYVGIIRKSEEQQT